MNNNEQERRLHSFTNVVGFIIEHIFISVDNAEHLRLLTTQVLEA